MKIRNWSLITGRGGGLQNRRGGGTSSFTPTKRGDGKSFSHAEGGYKKFWGSFYVGGARKVSTLLKGGRKKFYPVLRGGAQSFGPAIFPFCSSPLPVINDQSLSIFTVVFGGRTQPQKIHPPPLLLKQRHLKKKIDNEYALDMNLNLMKQNKLSTKLKVTCTELKLTLGH